ncbi:MAG TPA: bL35 family ribosomal protein [Candidatus Woesebacteria bacterium]|nr:bL35 family ribosomal protein [Candidatus Woesebacteria bacterium]
MANKVKQRTHKGAAKRFKITAGGKVLHRSLTLRHLRSSKTKKQVRSLKQLKPVEGKIKTRIEKLLALK